MLLKNNNKKYNIRIITIISPGLLNDAETYKNIFENNNYSVEIYTNNINSIKKKNIEKKFNINLFLEEIIPNKYLYIFPSNINIFMPNQELFYNFNELKFINYILCKTKYVFSYFQYMKKENNFKYNCIYTKFTTNIPKNINFKNIKKNNNLFIHLAGKSNMKNTSILVYCWLKNNGYLHIDPKIELHITCYKFCFTKMLSSIKNYFKLDFNIKPINNIIKINNLYIYTNQLNIDFYKYLLVNANLAICISSEEGYGHYLNESRYFETCILTLNYPPMNELVINNYNGILLNNIDKIIKPKIRNFIINEHTDFQLYKVFPNIDELNEKLIYCIKNKNILYNLGKNGKKMFIKDKKFLYKKMNKLICNINHI